MSRVAVYSGPYIRPRLHGLGDDGMTDVFSSGYDPFATTPDAGSLPFWQQPAWTPTDVLPPSGGGFIGPPLPSGADTTAQATPSDIAWLQSNEAAQSGSKVSVPNFQPLANVISAAVGAGTAPSPSPRVAVPLSPSSMGLWLSGTTMGMPTWLVIGGGVLLVALLASGGKRR
jgi:hypothetical protein